VFAVLFSKFKKLRIMILPLLAKKKKKEYVFNCGKRRAEEKCSKMAAIGGNS
jgi:hypothetical protein